MAHAPRKTEQEQLLSYCLHCECYSSNGQDQNRIRAPHATDSWFEHSPGAVQKQKKVQTGCEKYKLVPGVVQTGSKRHRNVPTARVKAPVLDEM